MYNKSEAKIPHYSIVWKSKHIFWLDLLDSDLLLDFGDCGVTLGAICGGFGGIWDWFSYSVGCFLGGCLI